MIEDIYLQCLVFSQMNRTTWNQQTKKKGICVVTGVTLHFDFHSSICFFYLFIYLFSPRSAGGLYKASRAEGSPVL